MHTSLLRQALLTMPTTICVLLHASEEVLDGLGCILAILAHKLKPTGCILTISAHKQHA